MSLFNYTRKRATIQEIAEIVGLHRNTVAKHILQGVLNLRDISSIVNYCALCKGNAHCEDEPEGIRCEIGIN